jgi:hypothetical protein
MTLVLAAFVQPTFVSPMISLTTFVVMDHLAMTFVI